MFINKIHEDKYNARFHLIYGALREQENVDPDKEKNRINKFLTDLYAFEGSDWTGRGESKDITVLATIAAYETYLLELKDMDQKNKP
jgi:hypothetical protein